MNFLKKIGAALDRMIYSNPFTTIGGVIITGILVTVSLGFLAVKAPLIILTGTGVAAVWIMVLFVNKFIEEVKR